MLTTVDKPTGLENAHISESHVDVRDSDVDVRLRRRRETQTST